MLDLAARLAYYASIPVTWVRMTLHNTWGILNVVDIIWLRPFRGGMLDADHPFCTGIDPESGRPIWHANVVFRTPRRPEPAGAPSGDSDDDIIEKVGRHLAHLCAQAARTPDHPAGRPSRMPPGILYIHGAVHYNGGFLLFEDFREAMAHFSNPEFRAEFRRFVRAEGREPVTVFRTREYSREEFIEFVCFLRTVLPWFSNSNGNLQRVGWGNPSPYPAVNTITGNWMRDTRLVGTGRGHLAPRPPIAPGRYFQATYCAGRSAVTLPERLLARFTVRRVALRGAKGNLFFVDRRKLARGRRFYSESLMNPLARFRRRLAGDAHGRFAKNDYHFGTDAP